MMKGEMGENNNDRTRNTIGQEMKQKTERQGITSQTGTCKKQKRKHQRKKMRQETTI